MAKKQSYVDIIESIMLQHGYHASLQLIYREFFKHKDHQSIAGKTPLATLREKVQRNKRFVRIGLGVYALSEYQNKLPVLAPALTKREHKDHQHSKIQGMLLEIGNSRKGVEDTYTADKSPIFTAESGVGMKLGSIATLDKVPDFTYSRIIQKIRGIDVIWFNLRAFPDYAFEIEHSTNFRGALVKFSELQDFNMEFCCVAEKSRRQKFDKEVSGAAFLPIAERCKFYSYEEIEHDYEIALRKQKII